jgi:translocation and assembly module TamB
VVVTGVVLGGVVWYLGRETTLQMIAERVAKASGGKLTLTGVSGSLYGHMHIDRVVFRTETQLITADVIDIDWKPWQYLSRGVEINKLYAKSLRMETLKESTSRRRCRPRLAPPFKIAVDDARLAKGHLREQGRLDRNRRHPRAPARRQGAVEARLRRASTPWGQVAANGTIANTLPYKLVQADASQTQARRRQAKASRRRRSRRHRWARN